MRHLGLHARLGLGRVGAGVRVRVRVSLGLGRVGAGVRVRVRVR